MAVSATTGPSTVVVVSPTPTDPPGTPTPTSLAATTALWKATLCDRLGNALADITTVGFDLTLHRGLNQPAQATIKVPAWHAYIATIHTDGDPYCEVGVRQLKLY